MHRLVEERRIVRRIGIGRRRRPPAHAMHPSQMFARTTNEFRR
jgi:hypothetical protein